jgi:hypothetical protein
VILEARVTVVENILDHTLEPRAFDRWEDSTDGTVGDCHPAVAAPPFIILVEGVVPGPTVLDIEAIAHLWGSLEVAIGLLILLSYDGAWKGKT